MKSLSKKFNRGDAFKLFLVVAFLPHVWTLIMTIRDIGWVAEGRTVSGAVGFSAYALVFTLVESLAVFSVILLLGLLISRQWSKDQRISSLGLIALILSAWSIVEQLILVLLYTRVVNLFSRFSFLGSSPWIGFLVLGILIAISFAVPVFLVLRSLKFTKVVIEIFDRLSLLSGFYLFFDVIAVIIVIVRNL
jgi:hypothetical protein